MDDEAIVTDLPETISGSPLIPSPNPNYMEHLRNFEDGLAQYLEDSGLPSANILVPLTQRQIVFHNAGPVIELIDLEQRQRSVYFSKFLAAVASGLFDAALNYLWDETIAALRKRVAQYDLSYFYDNAVKSQEKRKRLRSQEDLDKIDDSELVHGARAIELISALGFRHLEYIQFMRNWASAAHPNHNEITGLQLVSFAETCIREVLNLPLSDTVIEIKRLLESIRSTTITESEARQIATFFNQLSQDQVSRFAQGLFGIYTRADTSAQALQNVRLLLPHLWGRVEEPVRGQIGVKFGRFVANNDQHAKNLAREFIGIAGAESYIPDSLRAIEITSAMDELLIVHRGYNNFYTEPPLARELRRLVGDRGNFPSAASREYVYGLVEVFITNGHGVAENADPIYRELLGFLTSEQALAAILSFQEDTIATRLRRPLCEQHYRELLTMMRSHASAPVVGELIDHIEGYTGPIFRLRDDDRFIRLMAPYKTILESPSV
jgi:hypothetical protein